MFLCVLVFWRGKKSSPQELLYIRELLKKKNRTRCFTTHTHIHTDRHRDAERNSTDRKGNKITGGFGGKTNQRDMKGEREVERQRW